MSEMQANNGIQGFEPDDVAVYPGNTVDAVQIDVALQPVDAIEKIYISVAVSANTETE